MNDAHRNTFPQVDTDGNWYEQRGGLRMEVYDWLNENCPARALRPGGNVLDNKQWEDMRYVKQGAIREPIYVWFRDPNDALAFRLRWG